MNYLLKRRWRYSVLLALVIVAPISVRWARYEWECRKTERARDERLQDLRNKAEQLKTGATREDVEEFFRKNGIQYGIGPERRGEFAIGTVPLPPCRGLLRDDSAVIAILVRFDLAGKVVSKDVRVWRPLS